MDREFTIATTLWPAHFPGEVEFVHVLNVDDARKAIAESEKPPAAVVVGFMINSSEPTKSSPTPDFIRELRSQVGQDLPIIGTSCIGDYQRSMAAAGATRVCQKREVPDALKELLELE